MATQDERFPTKYLAAADLKGKPFTLTMQQIVKERVGRDNDERWVLYFRGAKKGFILNKTNDATISAFYGSDDRNWIGKEITLYPTTTQFGGETKDCIRVRSAGANGDPQAPLSQPEQKIEHPDYSEDLNDEIPF